jgi:hypothetical protein
VEEAIITLLSREIDKLEPDLRGAHLRPDWVEAATRHRRRPAQLVLGGVDTDSGAVFGGPAAHQS